MPRMRPERYHAIIALTIALALTAGIFFLIRLGAPGWRLLVAWLVSINLVTFGYYGYDKGRARADQSRVPEVILHGMAFVGGTLGAWLAMQLFRHKTIKGNFRIIFWTIAIMQVGIIAAAVYRIWRTEG